MLSEFFQKCEGNKDNFSPAQSSQFCCLNFLCPKSFVISTSVDDDACLGNGL